MAPDPAIVQSLLTTYVSEPRWRSTLDEGTDVTPAPDAVSLTTQRTEEAKGIVALDTGITEYMKALGALSADSVVQSSANVSDLKNGLTAISSASPGLGITSTDVALVSEFVQATADLAENGYRDAKLAQLIGDNDASFQKALDVQIEIVNRAIIPSINEYKLTIDSKQRYLRTQTKSIQYLYSRILSADQDNADLQLKAATSYSKALGDIKTADAALYANRNNVLTMAMFEQVKGPAQEAYKAFQDYRAAVATSVSK